MSIANYSDLLTAVANWTGRADLTSRIPEGIVLAEAKMNRKLRTKDMEVLNPAFPIAGEYVALPYGFGGARAFAVNTTPKQILGLMASDLLTTTYADGATGVPKNYAIEANQFHFGPAPDASYTARLLYYLTVPALTSTATTNWVMTNHPDAYLYGVTAEMSALAKDWESAATWEKMLYQVLSEIVGISNRDRWSGGSLAAQPG